MTHNDKFAPKQFSRTDDQEDEGNLILQNLVLKNKRVKLRLGGNDKTANRDGFIELRNDSHAIGKLELQVKPVDSERKKENHLCYQLDASLVGHSKLAGLPFILICYDRDARKAYWKLITEQLFAGAKSNQQTRTVDFLPEDEIGDELPYTENWLRLNREHLDAKMLAERLRAALKSLQSDPHSPFVYQLDSPEAVADLLKSIENHATEVYRARLQDAERLYLDGQIEAATTMWRSLSAELSTNEKLSALFFDVSIWLGTCNYRLENLVESESCLRDALKIDGNSWRAQANLAHILFVQNKSKKEALSLAQAAYSGNSHEEYVIATYLLCLSFNYEQDTIDSTLKDRAAIVDNSSVIQMALALIAKAAADHRAASAFFKQAFELNPANHHAKILFAESIYELMRVSAFRSLTDGMMPDFASFEPRLDQAISYVDSAIAFFSSTTDRFALHRCYDIRALINLLKGKFEAALADCEKMDAVIPNKVFAKIVRAQIYTQINRFDDVILLLQPLANDDRKDVLQALAYSCYQTDKYTDAAGYYSRYLDEDNDSEVELCAYAQCLWKSGNKKKAYQVSRKLRLAGRAPIDIVQNIELARLTEPDIQDWTAALEVLEALLRLDGTNPVFWLQRLAAHMQMGNKAEALKYYRELPLRLIRNDEWATDFLADLESSLRKLRWFDGCR